tara:strand:- start:870 stop:1481 length:612 start_codon:yes stop_codon:yes gene_type:complete
MSNNNYVNAQTIINNSEFSLKGLKTFMGMDCPGINASLYFKGKKVAFLIDEGNGGCLNIDWVMIQNKEGHIRRPEYVDNAIIAMKHLEESLPEVTWADVSAASKNDYGSEGKYSMDEEQICNELIDTALKQKDFKKLMKKVSVLTTNDEIASYKAKADQLDNSIMIGGRKWVFRNYVKSQSDIKLILNDLPTDEAFKIYRQYA